MTNTDFAATKADNIIRDLMHALDVILREAEKDDASRHYIAGAAGAAMKACDRQRVRNSDGYLVVPPVRELCTRCDGDGFNGTYTESCERCGGSGKEVR